LGRAQNDENGFELPAHNMAQINIRENNRVTNFRVGFKKGLSKMEILSDG
jgi:hypothetical protein